MKRDLFRREVVEKMSSPEDLNAYVKVLRPQIWLILLGIAIAVAGLIVFVTSTGFPVWTLLFGEVGV